MKAAGDGDIVFIDAMTDDLSDDDLRARLADRRPAIVGAAAITPSIYKAERALEIADQIETLVNDHDAGP